MKAKRKKLTYETVREFLTTRGRGSRLNKFFYRDLMTTIDPKGTQTFQRKWYPFHILIVET